MLINLIKVQRKFDTTTGGAKMDPFKKKDPQVEADTLREVVRDSLNKRKKPVKFTF